uniref:Protein ANTAGONIST OF LIKE HETEROCHROMATIN PROTEIN 1-like n=1 Tax=Diabrotica virgifera virgifera TaxID=50390 RepID=A0A6P7H144_DIAVI
FLASGDSMVSISYSFLIGTSTVIHIIRETCKVMWDCLNEEVLLKPTPEVWLQIDNGFLDKWHLPHCVGAIDGKHIIQAPPKLVQLITIIRNHYYSIVLLAVCDAYYKFTLVDIGSEGRHSDGGILKNSNIGQLLFNNQLSN